MSLLANKSAVADANFLNWSPQLSLAYIILFISRAFLTVVKVGYVFTAHCKSINYWATDGASEKKSNLKISLNPLPSNTIQFSDIFFS